MFLKLTELKIWNKDQRNGQLLKYFLSDMVIALKSVASRIYEEVNLKSMIYISSMKDINQKLAKVGF